MITEQQYNDALQLIRSYQKQERDNAKLPPYAVKLDNHPNHYVDKQGNVYQANGLKCRTKQGWNRTQKRIEVFIDNKRYALPTLVATQFCSKIIIFIYGNLRNRIA